MRGYHGGRLGPPSYAAARVNLLRKDRPGTLDIGFLANMGAGGTNLRPSPSPDRQLRSEIRCDPRSGVWAAPGGPPRHSPGAQEELTP